MRQGYHPVGKIFYAYASLRQQRKRQRSFLNFKEES